MAKRKSGEEGGGTAVAEKRKPGRPKKNAPPAHEGNGHAATAEASDGDEPKRGRKAKQQDLIPDAFDRIQEIQDASELLDAKRTRRIKLLGEEVAAETQLAEIMLKHGRDVYKYDRKTVIRKHSEKDKVTIKTDDEESKD